MNHTNQSFGLCAIAALALFLGCGNHALAQEMKFLEVGKLEVAPKKTGPSGLVEPVNPGPPKGSVPVSPGPGMKKPHPDCWGKPGYFPGYFPGYWPPPVIQPAHGHFEIVTETVMVEPQRVEKFWVPPQYETVMDPQGNPQVVKVKDGYLAERIVPARYETIQRQVWVPSKYFPGVTYY